MLSSKAHLEARQGKHGTPRHDYLTQLVNEYHRTPHWLRREEIVAHLANFAYDPINFHSIRTLRIVELFIDILQQDQHQEDTEQEATKKRKRPKDEAKQSRWRNMVEFALGGICNCIPDPTFQHLVTSKDAMPLIHAYLPTMAIENDRCALQTALSAMTICYFALDHDNDEDVFNRMNKLQSHPNSQIRNLALAFSMRLQQLEAQQAQTHGDN